MLKHSLIPGAIFTVMASAACGHDLDTGERVASEAEIDEHSDLPLEDAPGEDTGAEEANDDDDDMTLTVQSRSARCDGNAHTGDYCGGDKVSDGDDDTLYRCNGPGAATVRERCAAGCVVAPAGQDDYCRDPPPPTCDDDARTGDYCGSDKVSFGNRDTLYRCEGPGRATRLRSCSEGCVIAPAGQDDHCRAPPPPAPPPAGSCEHHARLEWGLAPAASDHLRCAGVGGSAISQTIGNASASAGTHARDGTLGGQAYCAATDLSVSGLSNRQVRALLNRLTDEGFVAFFRNPGQDGWPSREARHLHVIYAGVPMKSALRAQVQDWRNGRNGLASHSAYTFFQPTTAQRRHVMSLFNAAN
jgi:hypothetical protein